MRKERKEHILKEWFKAFELPEDAGAWKASRTSGGTGWELVSINKHNGGETQHLYYKKEVELYEAMATICNTINRLKLK